MQHQDSTGRTIRVGDIVRWRGKEFTIKAFKDERDHFFKVPQLEFEEPLHISDEIPNEFTVDFVRSAPTQPIDPPNVGFSLQESVSTIKLDGIFKSWRDEFNSEDVEKHLADNNITEFVYNGICGDGDILLKTNKGPLTCVSMEDLSNVMKAFSPHRLSLEPYENELLLTMTWNADARDEHESHGRGTELDGPDEPDCPCRGTEKQDACADTGCGFCMAARSKR